jgi:phenylpropionate dioxygenase-like ring-hydroxylating dioxygenase large terminal subunit
MAKIEKDFIERENPTKRDFKAEPFIPRKPIPDLGHEKLDGERFYSREFMQKEWDSVWTKTWQVVHRESELEFDGSFITHSIGKESFLIVRGNDGKIRAFYNVCQHRGNQLCTLESGELDTFSCPFHGWKWNNDGTLNSVFAPELYKQFKNGVPTEDLGLPEVKIDTWGGWLWINMDPDCISLKDYLSDYGEHLESYNFENWALIDYQTFEWNGNWKHAVDAFNESYHFTALHPDMVQFGEGHDVPIEISGNHSRMINFNETVSEVVEDRETFTPLRSEMMGDRSVGKMQDIDDSYKGVAKDLHLYYINKRRAEEDVVTYYKNMNDEQLVHQYHYFFFPSAVFTNKPEAGNVFRYRPHPTDPDKCYYDFFILINNTDNNELPPRRPHKIYKGNGPELYDEAFEGTFPPVFNNVLAQDGSNMETMQWGSKSDSFKGGILCEQEIRVRHFHQTIDKFIEKYKK